MENGTLIAIGGNLYEYGHYDGDAKCHIAYTVEIDEDGNLTATYDAYAFADEELLDNKIELSPFQWEGLVRHFLLNDYEMTEEELGEVVEDIVCRGFAVTGLPTIEELPKYIDEYMDR